MNKTINRENFTLIYFYPIHPILTVDEFRKGLIEICELLPLNHNIVRMDLKLSEIFYNVNWMKN